MRKLKKAILGLLIAVAVSGSVAAGYVWRALVEPRPPLSGEVIVEIPNGHSSEQIVDLLVEGGVLGTRLPALGYLYLGPYRGRLQAGEYLFDQPLNVRGVFEKLASGDVLLHTFAVPEGLRLDQVALRWEEAGFGGNDDFIAAARAALDQVRRIDPEAVSVEGYLFPETYAFPRGVTAEEAVTAMVRGYRSAIERLMAEVDPEDWPLDLHETLVMASLVESEAARTEERALISSVFYNRLDRQMRLECDPTVIYALIQAGSYEGRLLRVDLSFDSPYNTYVHAGLPPGPISSPGFASLQAAVQPDTTDFIFFVRTEGGRHTFSRTLAEHNLAVAAYRQMMQ
jgi:UPF0755 protein